MSLDALYEEIARADLSRVYSDEEIAQSHDAAAQARYEYIRFVEVVARWIWAEIKRERRVRERPGEDGLDSDSANRSTDERRTA